MAKSTSTRRGSSETSGARLVATQSAEGWLDERAERLRRQLASTRREASTQEAIEIAAGARARLRMVRATSVEVRKRGA
jgi:F0F1-type ATP synthase gamma subunit